MSADWGISELMHGGATLPTPERSPVEVGSYQWNVTYNLTAMLREAGWVCGCELQRVWCTSCLHGAALEGLRPKVVRVMANLLAEPDRYRAMNPPNGWGDYDGLVQVWSEWTVAVLTLPGHHTLWTWF